MAIGAPVDLGHNSTTGNVNTVTLTGVTVAAGLKIVVFAGGGNNTATTVTFTDSAGNTWTTDAANGGASAAFMGSSDITNALSSGTLTATWNTTVNTNYMIAAISISGLKNGLGTGTPSVNNGSGAGWSSGTMTTTGYNEIFLGCGVRGVVTSSTPGAAYTEIHDFADAARTMSTTYVISGPASFLPGGTWANGGTWRGVGATYLDATLSTNIVSPQTVPFMGTPDLRI